MRKIYYKEGIHITNKKEYILTYLNLNTPTTYFIENDFIQCRPHRARTFNDLFLLLKAKFKTATKGDLARILLDEENSNDIGCVACPDVHQMTFYNEEFKSWGHYTNSNTFDRSEIIIKGPQWRDLTKWATASKSFELIDKYKLIDRESYIKKAKGIFIQFLEEKGIYDEYMGEFKSAKGGDRNGLERFMNYNAEEPNEWINYSLTWSDTKSGYDYWNDINEEYKKYIKQHA